MQLKLEKERLLEPKTDDTLSQTKQIMEVIRDTPDCLDGFDAELFGELIDKIIVEDNTHLRFRLKTVLSSERLLEGRCGNDQQAAAVWVSDIRRADNR